VYRQHRRRYNPTIAYLLPGCASIGAPVFLTLTAVGMLIFLWIITQLGAILSAVLGLAILGNSVAFLIGVIYLGYSLLTHQPTKRIAPAHTIHIMEIQPTPASSPAAALEDSACARSLITPPAPMAHASRQRTSVYVRQPENDTREPVYLPGSKRIAGWQYLDGTIRWVSTQQANSSRAPTDLCTEG
jgi:hypothetical protein